MINIIKKEQVQPENYAHFFFKNDAGAKEIRVVLCNGIAIECSKHKRAFDYSPCECMQLANTAPDKDEYWKPYMIDEDYSDLIDD